MIVCDVEHGALTLAKPRSFGRVEQPVYQESGEDLDGRIDKENDIAATAVFKRGTKFDRFGTSH